MRGLSIISGLALTASGLGTALTIDPFDMIQGIFQGIFGLLIIGGEQPGPMHHDAPALQSPLVVLAAVPAAPCPRD